MKVVLGKVVHDPHFLLRGGCSSTSSTSRGRVSGLKEEGLKGLLDQSSLVGVPEEEEESGRRQRGRKDEEGRVRTIKVKEIRGRGGCSIGRREGS